jgi:hypothetical protein
LMEKPEKKTLEKPSSIWQDNIKTVLKETGWEGPFEHGNKPSFSVKCRGISCLDNELSACEDGVRFVQLGCRPECNIFGRSRPNNLTGVAYKNYKDEKGCSDISRSVTSKCRGSKTNRRINVPVR